MQVAILEAKNRLSELIEAVRAGEEVVITKRGKPMARLIAAETAATSIAGDARAILDWVKNHRIPLYARRSAEQIDITIAEERSS